MRALPQVAPSLRLSIALGVLLFAPPPPRAVADEGFWTPDRFPRQLVKDRYGVELGDALLDRAARAAVLGRRGYPSPGGASEHSLDRSPCQDPAQPRRPIFGRPRTDISGRCRGLCPATGELGASGAAVAASSSRARARQAGYRAPAWIQASRRAMSDAGRQARGAG
jgi:hypothetical protein